MSYFLFKTFPAYVSTSASVLSGKRFGISFAGSEMILQRKLHTRLCSCGCIKEHIKNQLIRFGNLINGNLHSTDAFPFRTSPSTLFGSVQTIRLFSPHSFQSELQIPTRGRRENEFNPSQLSFTVSFLRPRRNFAFLMTWHIPVRWILSPKMHGFFTRVDVIISRLQILVMSYSVLVCSATEHPRSRKVLSFSSHRRWSRCRHCRHCCSLSSSLLLLTSCATYWFVMQDETDAGELLLSLLTYKMVPHSPWPPKSRESADKWRPCEGFGGL